MDGLIAFHVIALGVWAGIVAVELLYESAGFLGRLEPTTVAKLHLWTDRYLELPVLLLVVTSGLLLWQRAGWSAALAWKAGAGLAAVAFNLLCAVLVERRAKIADEPAAQRYAKRMWLTVSPGFPFAFVALYLGGARAGWW